MCRLTEELCPLQISSRLLCSSDGDLLQIPPTKEACLVGIRDRAFSVVPPPALEISPRVAHLALILSSFWWLLKRELYKWPFISWVTLYCFSFLGDLKIFCFTYFIMPRTALSMALYLFIGLFIAFISFALVPTACLKAAL